MHQRDGGGHERVFQIGKIRGELGGEQHALIHQGSRRKAGEVADLGTEEAFVTELGEGALAHDVEFALEGEFGGELGGAADEKLADVGLAGLGGFAEGGVVGGHGAPADEGEPLALDHLGDFLFDLAAMGGVARQEEVAGAVVAGVGQGEAGLLGGVHAEGVRHLEEDAGAVAGVGLAAGGAAMVEIFEHLDALTQNGVGGAALQIGDEADAARVVLKPRIIKTLLGGAASAGLASGLNRGGDGRARVIHSEKMRRGRKYLGKGRMNY